jgi:hypothetical protein
MPLARFCDVSDDIYDRLQGGAFIAYPLFVLLASLEDYLFPNVLNRFDEYEPSLLLQMPIHSSNLAPKDAVNRNSQRRSLSVHRAAATDYKVREPSQVYVVDSMFGNHHLVVCGPLPQVSRKVLACFSLREAVSRGHPLRV